MLKEHAKLLVLFQEAGEVIGRKKLQKIVYISKKFRFDFQEKFNFHFYGPYSEELSLQIEELTNLGFIQESKENKGGYSQYKYELSPQGREYLGIYPTAIEGYDQFIPLVNQESSRFLELVSTMLYFDKLNKEELIEKIGKVKSRQNYSVDEIEKALEFCKNLTERFSHSV
jgi:uncharacterized protein YwgA